MIKTKEHVIKKTKRVYLIIQEMVKDTFQTNKDVTSCDPQEVPPRKTWSVKKILKVKQI